MRLNNMTSRTATTLDSYQRLIKTLLNEPHYH